MSVGIKHHAIIFKKYHGIDGAVNNQERDQKQTGKPHRKLLANRRSKKLFKSHYAKVNGWILESKFTLQSFKIMFCTMFLCNRYRFLFRRVPFYIQIFIKMALSINCWIAKLERVANISMQLLHCRFSTFSSMIILSQPAAIFVTITVL